MASAAEPLLAGFERDIDRAPAPLGVDLLRTALAADNLLKLMATEYQAIAAMLSSRDAAAAPAVKQATWLSVRLLTRRPWLACRAGKIASAAAWRHLHRLRRLARERGFAGYGEAGNTVESNFVADRP